MSKAAFKRIVSLALIGTLSASLLAGCSFGGEEPDEEVIDVYHEEPTPEYTMDVVRRGDVESSLSINATYVQITQEDVYFKAEGLTVEHVYVKVGDEVKAGDVIAQCRLDDVKKQREQLLEDVEYNELMLKQVTERRDLELELRESWFSWTYGYEKDKQELEEDLDEIRAQYKSSIEDYEDKIYIANLKISECDKKIKDGTLVAPISGNVSFVKTDLEGNRTDPTDKVFTIVDNSVCAFRTDKTAKRDLFYEGQKLQLRVGLGTKMTIYEAEPFMMDKWDKYLYFKLTDEQVNITTGTLGTIYVDMDSVHDVLYLPNKYIRKANDVSYVYTIDENGFRSVKYIKTGLVGLEYTEITEGLSEGDFVILK